MAKRHTHGVDFVSRVRRMQELIMSTSGVDEFYEIVRLILAKFFAEQEGHSGLPDVESCNRLLARQSAAITFSLDGMLTLQTQRDIFPDIQEAFSDVSVGRQGFIALDQAFEQLTSRHYKADKGQYFTPRHVIDMCVEAIAPRPGEYICDPACGSAAFLNAAYTYGLKHHGTSPNLHGFDYSHRACQVARVVSLIATNETIKIEQLDSLTVPGPELFSDNFDTIESVMGPAFNGFDVILTNPPFAGDVAANAFAKNYELASGGSRRIERDVLFVERCIRLLRDGGRLAIILPDNKISSRSFRDVRAWLGNYILDVGPTQWDRMWDRAALPTKLPFQFLRYGPFSARTLLGFFRSSDAIKGLPNMRLTT